MISEFLLRHEDIGIVWCVFHGGCIVLLMQLLTLSKRWFAHIWILRLPWQLVQILLLRWSVKHTGVISGLMSHLAISADNRTAVVILDYVNINEAGLDIWPSLLWLELLDEFKALSCSTQSCLVATISQFLTLTSFFYSVVFVLNFDVCFTDSNFLLSSHVYGICLVFRLICNTSLAI